jgi:signal transduction histidine kinase/ActR/RegA family two-component response regulator
MILIPISIAKYVRSLWMAEMVLTYLHVDRNGILVSWGGYPNHYGLGSLATGKPASEQVSFLEGLLPIDHTEVLEFVSTSSGRSAHVHLLPFRGGTWVLFFDASTEHDRQQKIQQQANELSLLTYRQSQLIQELEYARQMLITEKQQLEDSSQLKTRFIADLSHELRTPLASIAGYTRLLDNAERKNDKHTSDYLNTIQSSTQHLLSLIDNILEQSKIEMGQVVLAPRACDLKKLLKDLKALFLPHANEKGLTLEVKAENIPVQVMIDELRLRQILINLVTNALKFTEKGTVTLTLRWQADQLNLSVTDTGLGISEEGQQKIFQAFHRETKTQGTQGAGLGLAISYHLIKIMGGTLRVLSKLGKGSQFFATVQAPSIYTNRSEAVAERNHEQTHPDVESSKGSKVLLVEDALFLHKLFEICLSESGYEVISAYNGEEALQLIDERQPDIIITDMLMPVLNGYDFVKQLRAKNYEKPIIALSASNLEEDKHFARQIGCSAYLAKPVEPRLLLQTIHKLLTKTTA